ncbi:MAG: hypothetical protein UHO61_01180 [Acutalibacteraceae bacterium]|nr:hypothetical protein [Acutalibacteraceae bacterium]
MTEALISAGAAVVVGLLSLVGVMISNSRSNSKMQNDIKTAQAVTDERISELTREVRMHNDFARRIPVIEEQLKVANHRVSDLEELHKPNN